MGAVTVTFTIPRVPPSLSNQHAWWTQRHRVVSEWKQQAWMRAQAARNERRLRHPAAEEPARKVVITMHRAILLDTDNAYASVKGIVDGLKGVLIYDDSPRYCELEVRQVKTHVSRSGMDSFTEVSVEIDATS